MNDLEKKFYKYLDRQCVADDFKWKELRKNIAHELAEIAEKHFKIMINNVMSEVWKENITLKKQIERIRYLDRKEVKKLVSIGILHDNPKTYREQIENITTAICNLAIPSREKIIGVLNRFESKNIICKDNKTIRLDDSTLKLSKKSIEQIATEILQPKIDCYDKQGEIIKEGEDE